MFLSWLFGYAEKQLEKKVKVNSIIYDFTDWTTITIYTLPNISRSKGNQTMKSIGQLIEYNVRNNFFKNNAENEAGD